MFRRMKIEIDDTATEEVWVYWYMKTSSCSVRMICVENIDIQKANSRIPEASLNIV